MNSDQNSNQEPEIDSFFDQLDENNKAKPFDTPEEEFYSYFIGHSGKLALLRYWIYSYAMPVYYFMLEKKIGLTIADTIETKPIVGSSTVKPSTKQIQRLVTPQEWAKLITEQYLLTYHYPRFVVLDDQPQRKVCSISAMVDMLTAHEAIQEAVNKKY